MKRAPLTELFNDKHELVYAPRVGPHDIHPSVMALIEEEFGPVHSGVACVNHDEIEAGYCYLHTMLTARDTCKAAVLE
jgi:hypothetical protein